MGRNRKYVNNADKQAAYRDRHQCADDVHMLRMMLQAAGRRGLIIRIDPCMITSGSDKEVLAQVVSQVREQYRGDDLPDQRLTLGNVTF